MNNSYIYIYHVNVTQTVPDISPLMPMHQDPLLVCAAVTTIPDIGAAVTTNPDMLQPTPEWGWL